MEQLLNIWNCHCVLTLYISTDITMNLNIRLYDINHSSSMEKTILDYMKEMDQAKRLGGKVARSQEGALKRFDKKLTDWSKCEVETDSISSELFCNLKVRFGWKDEYKWTYDPYESGWETNANNLLLDIWKHPADSNLKWT